MPAMTHETCDVLELLEDLGLQVAWSEIFDPSIRRTAYTFCAVDDECDRWIVVGDHESAVVDAMLEQLDWDLLEKCIPALQASAG